MKPAVNINNLFEKSKITVGTGVDKKILNKAVCALPRKSAHSGRLIWSYIMYSKRIKFIAAAVIIITIFFSLTLFDKTVSPAYAIKKTLHAIQKTNWIHAVVEIELKGSDGAKTEESWIGFKDSIEINKRSDGNIRFEDGANGILYHYNAESNTVTISSLDDQYAAPRLSPIPSSPVELLEQLITNIEQEGQAQVSIEKKSVDSRDIRVIQIDAKYKNDGEPEIDQTIILEVEEKTDLLLNMHMTAFTQNEKSGSATVKFDYPALGPADIYAIGQAADATIIDRLPAITDSAEIEINHKIMMDSEDSDREKLVLYGDLNMDLIKVDPGQFLMGAASEEIGYPERLLQIYGRSQQERVRNLKHPSSEDPQHLVQIKEAFYISQYEITCAQFRMFKNEYRKMPHFVGNLGSKTVECTLDNDDQPTGVSFKDATDFCNWLSEKSGLKVRLACEAEWEYACRAGTTTRFFWGDSEQEAGKYANLTDISYENAAPRSAYTIDADDGFVGLAPVGQYLPNAFDLYDMLGNISEWTNGTYSDNALSIDPQGRQYENSENLPVVKGGSWQVGALINGRCASRTVVKKEDLPETSDSFTGFRIVVDEP